MDVERRGGAGKGYVEGGDEVGIRVLSRVLRHLWELIGGFLRGLWDVVGYVRIFSRSSLYRHFDSVFVPSSESSCGSLLRLLDWYWDGRWSSDNRAQVLEGFVQKLACSSKRTWFGEVWPVSVLLAGLLEM